MDTPDHKRYSSLCKGHALVLLLYHRQQWYSFKQKSPDWQMLLGVSVRSSQGYHLHCTINEGFFFKGVSEVAAAGGLSLLLEQQ